MGELLVIPSNPFYLVLIQPVEEELKDHKHREDYGNAVEEGGCIVIGNLLHVHGSNG